MKTIDSFVKACAKLPERGWKAKKIGRTIRLMPPIMPPDEGSPTYCGCPITSVIGDRLLRKGQASKFWGIIDSKQYERAAVMLGLESGLRDTIVDKADFPLFDYEETEAQLLRIRLLRIFGLSIDNACRSFRFKQSRHVEARVKGEVTRYTKERKEFLKRRRSKRNRKKN